MSIEDHLNDNHIRIELLDSGSGRVMQHWVFPCSVSISVGRSPENKVVIQDPYVSRHHVDLEFDQGQWRLTNRGRHGTLLEGGSIVESWLPRGASSIQLGGLGPTVRASYGQPQQRSLDTTVMSAPAGWPAGGLAIDQERIRREVQMITETPYFRSLRQVRERIRAARAQT